MTVTDAEATAAALAALETDKTDEQVWAEVQAERTNTDGQPVEGDGKNEVETTSEEGRNGNEEADDDLNAESSGKTPQGEAEGEVDIFAGATPEQLTELERLRTKEKRGRGQVSSLQRKINDLKAKLSDTDPDDDAEDMKKLQDDYPEVAGPILKRQQRQDQKLNLITEISQLEATQAAEDQQERVQQQAEIVNDRHADWQDVLKAAGQSFMDWADDQPKATRDAVDANMEAVTDGEALVRVMDQFKKFQTAGDAPEQGQQATKTNHAKRQVQLRGARVTTGTVQQPVVADPDANSDDPDLLWKSVQKQRAMEKRARG